MSPEESVQLKERAVNRILAKGIKGYKLKKIDPRLEEYVTEVCKNPERHNLFEVLAVVRFFAFLDKYKFRPNEVQLFIKFYECLKFSGLKGRQSYKLTPVQVFQFANIMGFYTESGRRLTREALLFVPRKFSKTTSVASLAVYDLLFGDSNAEVYTAANSYYQAQICFKEIKAILRGLDPGLKMFKLNREKIEIIGNLERSSSVQCLSSSADKLDGLNASLVILDEYSQADSAELKNVLTSSMGARLDPLVVTITTASDKSESPFVEMLENYKRVLLGEIENDRIFAHLFMPDEGDDEGSPEVWKKVQPHLGVTVQPEFYENEWQKALISKEDMKTFRTKLLNIFVPSNLEPWLTGEEMKMHAQNIDIDKIGKRVSTMVAVDLSVKDDFSAVTYGLYFSDKKKFHFHTDYYFPEECLNGHRNEELYRKWAAEGHLNLTKGNVIDYSQIAGDIIARNKNLLILQIGYDSYKSLDFVNLMSASGAAKVMQPIKQTYASFTSPVESWEYATRKFALTINPNPINYFCFDNAVLDEDKLENKKPIKRSRYLKIDGVITMLMSLKEFNDYERKVS